MYHCDERVGCTGGAVTRAHSGYLVCETCSELLTPAEVQQYERLHFLIWADDIDAPNRQWYLTANQPDMDGDHLWGNFESREEATAHAEAHLALERELSGVNLDCRVCYPNLHFGCRCTRRCYLHRGSPRKKATR